MANYTQATRTDNKNHSVQESVHTGTGVGRYVSSTALTYTPRAIHSWVTRNFTLTFVDGTSAILLLNSGQMYPYAVKLVTSSTATAVAAVSTLVFPIL